MKYRLLTFAFLLISLVLQAQDSLYVQGIRSKMSRGEQPGFAIRIPQTNPADLGSGWKKYIRNQSRHGVSLEANEWVMARGPLKALGDDSLVIYARFREDVGNCIAEFFLGHDDQNFFDSTHAKSSLINSWVRDFGVQQYKEAVEDELKQALRSLQTYEQELRMLQSANENSEKKTREHKSDIERLQSEIAENKKQQEMVSQQILDQQKKVSQSPEGENRTMEEKKLKQLEKDKRRLEKDKDSKESDIEVREIANLRMDKSIKENTNTVIPQKQEQIGYQQNIVSDIKKKLAGIR